MSTANLRKKLDVLREKRVVVGGTFLKAVWATGQLDRYKQWLADLGLDHVEISDGAVDIRGREALTDRRARTRPPSSPSRLKDSSVEFSSDEWTQWLREELDAGA